MELRLGDHVFFCGIGGVGMSGLAHALLEQGFRVSGSDTAGGPTVDRLRAAGVTIFDHHSAGNLVAVDKVVRTTAVPDTNPEIMAARAAGLPVYHRSELLAWTCRGKQAVAITGTHGKSTTTMMAATIFLAAGQDPTVFVGADSPLLGANYHLGRGEHVIFEACESDRSFLNYVGASQVITSLEADHLDNYGSLDCLLATFAQFARLADPAGFLVYWGDSEAVRDVAAVSPARPISYGLGPGNDFRAGDILTSVRGTDFRVWVRGDPQAAVHLPTLGEHNALNALAALACATAFGVDFGVASEALAHYQPLGRRFEEVARAGGVRIVDDYAHHPTEIRATLASARAGHQGRIIAIFQPHLRSRTRDLLADFARAFGDADAVILTDIYQPREDGLAEFDAERLLEAVRRHADGKPVELIRDKEAVAGELAPRLRRGDLVLALGAGDVPRVSRQLAELLENGPHTH